MRNGLSKDLIARVLGGAPKWTVAELEEKFPPRNLPDGAMVTRFAPSPTGFMHIGHFYQMLIDKKLAQQSGGVFYLRIDDTDTAREIAGAVDIVLNSAKIFGLDPDEGPFFQSERKDIYHSVAAELLARGLAYPCFLTQVEMDLIRAEQKTAGFSTGIYGEWAKWRNASEQEIAEKLNTGEVPAVRLYSTGDKTRKIFCKDVVRGSIAFPENDEDAVLIKSGDGLPTYHFAHIVDDHFMRTTHVVRAEEWLPSLPLHIQLFNMMDWTPPVYIHTSTLDKIDAETKTQRKLSKRKDPEANMTTFIKDGWPTGAVLEYLFNIACSAYEENKLKGKVQNIWDAELNIKKIPTSGALFDMKKLEWWGKEFIAALSIDELVRLVAAWADEYGNEFNKKQIADRDYLQRILSIERDDPKRIRKDFITWRQTLDEISYFFADDLDINAGKVDKNVLSKFLSSFDSKDDKDLWWQKIQRIATELNIKNGDAAMTLRVALTGRENTPDLYSIMRVMGEERVRGYVNKILGGKND
jgi:glutamyl-tRNA synthetase